MNQEAPRVGSQTTPRHARTVPPAIRAGAVAVATASGAGAGLALAGRPLTQTRATLAGGTPWNALPLDVLLSSACAVALVICCLWLLTVTIATTLEVATGVSSAALRALTPHAVRRAVLLACGFAVGSAAVVGPATAATEAGPGGSQGRAAVAISDLDGLPLPDRAMGELREPVAPAPPPAGPGSGRAQERARGAATTSFPRARFRAATVATSESHPDARYQVRRGDSLWSLARRLRPGGDLEEVDRTWRRVYRLNRSEIGDDPDLLIPGTTLRLPSTLPHRKDAS